MDPMRQERLISCMNAAVNLYGVVSFAELIRLYNRYAADELAPVSNLLTEPEIDVILALPPPDDFDLEDQERWFKALSGEARKAVCRSTDRSTSRPQTRRVSRRTRSAASTPSAASTFRNDTFFVKSPENGASVPCTDIEKERLGWRRLLIMRRWWRH